MPALIMSDPIQQSISTINVICAWPVSGQYGPGSRILYYALVAACIIARKAEWLRSPCLAAALLIPAVSALHGVVIAILHVPGAIDMDIYGIFQACAIGILTAPVTVRLSNTYFNAPGRSIIFLWTAVVLAGLISLAIEFYRTQSQPCTPTDGQPLPSSYENFLNNNITCLNLTCSIADGPFSSLRQGSNNNIYVIPEPDAFKFGTATLLAAACCIPAILDLFSTWNKILDLDWKLHFGSEENPGSEDIDATIEGTNGATVRHMRGITRSLRMVRDGVAAPVFAAAVFAVLILGEKNFWSVQVNWQTEPMQSVGQWAPIVGTGLAVMGSLYMLLAADLKKEREEEALGGRSGDLECHCSPRCRQHRQLQRQRPSTHFSESQSNSEVDSGALTSPDILCQSPSQHSVELRAPSIQEIEGVAELPPKRSAEEDVGSRHKFARTLLWVGHKFGTAAQDRFNMDDFKRGKAKEFPEIPGEENRNPDLRRQRERYNHRRDEDEHPSPSGSGMHARNRSPSFAGSTRSNLMRSREEIARTPGTISRNPSTRSTSSISDNFPLEPSPRRGDTLEVPEPVYGRQSNSRRRSNPPVSPVSPISGPAPPSRGRKLGDIRSTSSPHLPHDNVTPMK